MPKIVLFQGDSITDSARGYVNLVSASLGHDYPNEYAFYNKGVSGNRIVDLYARIKSDFINLKPDYASIYIGVNDTWHEIGGNNGVDTNKFEKIYTMMIDEIKEALPNIKIMIIAPFVLEGSGTLDPEHPEKFELFKKDVAEKAEVSRKIAEKYGFPLIELQPAFNEALKKAPADYWTMDGVHPNAPGHELIKRLWIDVFNEMK